MKNILFLIIFALGISCFGEWKTSFDESSSKLKITNGSVEISGALAFESDGAKWRVANARDGVDGRLALIDPTGDVQGYVVFPSESGAVEILFYHRTAQAYKGVMKFSATVKTREDAFSCRSKAEVGERVLALKFGNADSLLNDSIYSPQVDEMLAISAANLEIETVGAGEFSVKMEGRITESAEARFEFKIKNKYFASRYIPFYKPLDRSRCKKTPTGWMSWNTYFDKATAEDNLAEARIGQKYLQPFGCEFWSIESWQGNSDKLPVSKFYNMNLEANESQFPLGMKKLAADIRALGFRAGLWVAPFGTGNKAFYEAHKDWFLHDADGNPISCWNGEYTLDPSVAQAREHLKNIFKTAAEDWGYEFFKIDGMSGRNKSYCAHLYERPEIRARFKNQDCKNPFELCVKAFRDGIGEDSLFLACQGHTSGAEARYADMARTGADIVHPNQPVKWDNVLLQARCTVNQIFSHNIAMIADPDTLLVKDLPTEQARVSATIVALPAQLTFFGDKLAGLDASQMKILQQTLPAPFVRPMNLYPYFSMSPVWNLSVENAALGRYNVVAFFNWGDAEAEISASAKELGIAPDAVFNAFEFWTQTYLGTASQKISSKVPARGVRVIVLTPAKKIPQIAGSDRHIAQCGIELKSLNWNPAENALSGDVELVKDFPLTLCVAIPEGFAPKSASCIGADCKIVNAEKNFAKIRIANAAGAENRTAKFKIFFDGASSIASHNVKQN